MGEGRGRADFSRHKGRGREGRRERGRELSCVFGCRRVEGKGGTRKAGEPRKGKGGWKEEAFNSAFSLLLLLSVF